MKDFQNIINALRKGTIKPVYLLFGDEPYFIDRITDYIAQNILTEDEKAFNQSVYYGRDADVDEVITAAKRFPMMAERQVVILKEAQALTSGNIADKLSQFEAYFKNPMPSTVLVIAVKYKKVDKRRTFVTAAKKNGVVFESKKLYENQVPAFIRDSLQNKGYEVTPKATQMLLEFLGTDLGKINNELDKLQIIVPKGATITPEIIEKNIGISKDYNNFELQNALGENDFKKAFRIIDYFSQNPNDHPILGTLPLLFRFFSQLLKYHGLSDKSQRNVASQLKINPFFVKDYVRAAQTFPMKKCSHAVAVLRDIDLRVKGVGSSSNLSQGDFLKELLVKIAR